MICLEGRGRSIHVRKSLIRVCKRVARKRRKDKK